MALRVQENDVFIKIYNAICNTVKGDANFTELTNNIVLEFDVVDQPAPSKAPRDIPRVYLLPQNVNIPIESSCCLGLTIGYEFVIDGFHVRSKQLQQLAFRLTMLLRSMGTLVISVDGREVGVQCTPQQGSWNYDADKQTMQYQIALETVTRI